jgi:hypothetical protein
MHVPFRNRIENETVHITLYWPAALTKTNRENKNVKYNIHRYCTLIRQYVCVCAIIWRHLAPLPSFLSVRILRAVSVFSNFSYCCSHFLCRILLFTRKFLRTYLDICVGFVYNQCMLTIHHMNIIEFDDLKSFVRRISHLGKIPFDKIIIYILFILG